MTAREPVRIRDTNTASPDNGARNPVAISFTFENVTLSNDLSKVTFDIYASCSQNGIKFGKSNIYIKYSPQVFGSSVASSGALTLSKGTIIQNTAYSFSKTDQTSDELEIEVSSTFISPNSLYELTTVPEQFCHLELDIQDFSALANIGFDAFQMIGQTWYYDVLSNTYVPFDRVDVESPIEGAMSGNPIGITFTFENAKITEDTAQYLELDVMAKAQSSGTEIQVIHLVLDYNTDAFGHSIYASNNVTVTHGDLLPTYNTTVVDAVDTEGSADNLGVTYTFSGFDFVELPTVPTLLCHLKMKVLNCEKKADVKFDVPTMLAFLPSAYVIDQVFQYTFYSPVEASDKYDQYLCSEDQPIITDFYPDTIPAGIGDSITIIGKNFGTKGVLNFTSVHSIHDGAEIFAEAFPEDSIFWSDTLIKYLVTSDLKNVVGAETPAATGRIKVIAENNMYTISDDTLNVPFAVVNIRENDIAYRINMVEGNEMGGYSFYVDSEFDSLEHVWKFRIA